MHAIYIVYVSVCACTCCGCVYGGMCMSVLLYTGILSVNICRAWFVCVRAHYNVCVCARCMCVCFHVCMCVCVCVCVHVCACMCTYVCVRMCVPETKLQLKQSNQCPAMHNTQWPSTTYTNVVAP